MAVELSGAMLQIVRASETAVPAMRELRNHRGRVLDRVGAGESVTVTRDGKAVARLGSSD